MMKLLNYYFSRHEFRALILDNFSMKKFFYLNCRFSFIENDEKNPFLSPSFQHVAMWPLANFYTYCVSRVRMLKESTCY